MTAKSPASLPIDDPLSWVEASMVSAAEAVSLTVVKAADLSSNVFRGGEDSASAQLSPSDLPASVRVMKVGRYLVLLGILPEQASTESVNEAVRRYRNQCVIARSYITPNEALDLQLILIGPRGSERVNDWQTLALLVERDDRVARKLVWLRPSDPGADTKSFEEFTKRSFLARPWNHDAVFTMAALDNLNRAAAMADSSIPRNTVDEWIKLALTESDDSAKLVDSLVEVWSRRGQA
jgi:hypothetical protein